MNTTRLNPLAESYLSRVDSAARVLPDQDREELVTELRHHLLAGLGTDASDVEVLNLLEDLGRPSEIVAAAASESAEQQQAPAEREPSNDSASRWGFTEIAAVVGLTVGTILVPLVGPLIGLCFAWASSRWTTHQKSIATGLTLLPLIALVLGAVMLTQSPSAEPTPNHPDTQHLLGVLT